MPDNSLYAFLSNDTGAKLPGAFGRFGTPSRHTDRHLSVVSVVLRVSAAHQALTALE